MTAPSQSDAIEMFSRFAQLANRLGKRGDAAGITAVALGILSAAVRHPEWAVAVYQSLVALDELQELDTAGDLFVERCPVEARS